MINLGMNEAYQEADEDSKNAAANSQPIPVGEYPVVVENIEWKQFGSGTWGFNLQLSVVGNSQHAGRKIFETYIIFENDGVTPMLRMDTRSKTMKNFGKIGYAKLCQAAGISPEQSGDAENIAAHLCSKVIVAKTKIVPKDRNNPNGEKDAKVSYFKPMAQAITAPQQAPQQATPSYNQPASQAPAYNPPSAQQQSDYNQGGAREAAPQYSNQPNPQATTGQPNPFARS